MRWNPSSSSSSFYPDLHELPARERPSSTAWVRDHGLEEVRRAMLQSLAGTSGCEVARMNIRLRYAGDIEALWYLRADLLDTLAALRGERRAKWIVAQVTAMFQGQLPRALRPAQPAHTPQMPLLPPH